MLNNHKETGREICFKINKVTYYNQRLTYVGYIDNVYWFDFQFIPSWFGMSGHIPVHKSFGFREWEFSLCFVWDRLCVIIEEEILNKMLIDMT
jgi:hypothetical protein